MRFISFSNLPATIPDYQIEILKKLLSKETDLELTSEQLEPGDPVEVIAGNLLGLTGELISYKGNKKVLIRLDHVEHSLLVTISNNFLRRRSVAHAN